MRTHLFRHQNQETAVKSQIIVSVPEENPGHSYVCPPWKKKTGANSGRLPPGTKRGVKRSEF